MPFLWESPQRTDIYAISAAFDDEVIDSFDNDPNDLLGLKAYGEYLQGKNPGEVVVAVMDSGINENHPIFQGRLLMKEAMDYTGDGMADDTGHGSHVAGIIADMTLSNVKILPIRIFKNNGTTDVMVSDAIDYLVELKKSVNLVAVNMSLGTEPVSVSDRPTSDYQNYKKAYQPLMDKLIAADILPIVSAGNSGSQNPSFPSICEGVIAVSAYNTMTSKLWYTSNYGNHVALTAPGASILSAWKVDTVLQSMSGTSMAAPFVAAAYAALISDKTRSSAASLGVSADEIGTVYMNAWHKALLFGAKDIGPDGNDKYFGYGLVDLTKFATLGVPDLTVKTPLPPAEPEYEPETAPDFDASMIIWLGLGLSVSIIVFYMIKGVKKDANTGE
jgi:subtilisin family serine protease